LAKATADSLREKESGGWWPRFSPVGTRWWAGYANSKGSDEPHSQAG